MITLVALLIGLVAGYYLCSLATWIRVHQQESNLRALATDIRISQDMDDEVPNEWVLAKLESMIAQDFPVTTHIDEMYAFVMLDPEDDTEGIIGFMTPDGQWMPMVGADTARIESLRPVAQEMATSLGRPVQVLRFTVREEIEVIQP